MSALAEVYRARMRRADAETIAEKARSTGYMLAEVRDVDDGHALLVVEMLPREPELAE